MDSAHEDSCESYNFGEASVLDFVEEWDECVAVALDAGDGGE